MGTHLSQNSETDANRRLLQSDAGNNATEVLKAIGSVCQQNPAEAVRPFPGGSITFETSVRAEEYASSSQGTNEHGFLVDARAGEVFSNAQDAEGGALLSMTRLQETSWLTVRSLQMLQVHFQVAGKARVAKEMASLVSGNPKWQDVLMKGEDGSHLEPMRTLLHRFSGELQLDTTRNLQCAELSRVAAATSSSTSAPLSKDAAAPPLTSYKSSAEPRIPQPPSSLIDSAQAGQGPRPHDLESDGKSTKDVAPANSNDALTSELNSPRAKAGALGYNRPLAEQPDKTSPTYKAIRKLLPVLQGGNQTAIVFALCQLQEIDLTDPRHQLTVLDGGGIDILMDLIRDSTGKLRLAAVQTLQALCSHPEVQFCVGAPSHVQLLVDLLGLDQSRDLVACAADTVRPIARFATNRAVLLSRQVVPKLLAWLRSTTPEAGPDEETGTRKLFISVVLALAQCCSGDTKMQEEVWRRGGGQLLILYLQEPRLPSDDNLLLPLLAFLREMLSLAQFRTLFRLEGGVEVLVRYLEGPSQPLSRICASCLYENGDDPEACVLLHRARALPPLLSLLSSNDVELVVNATGAVQRYTACRANARSALRASTLPALVKNLRHPDPDVLVRSLRACINLAKFAKDDHEIQSQGALHAILDLVNHVNIQVSATAAECVGESCVDAVGAAMLIERDGLQQLFALIRSNHKEAQVGAACALSRVLRHEACLTAMDQHFSGGMHILVSLLYKPDPELQTALCGVVANCACRDHMLQVLTEEGVLQALASLTSTTNNNLRTTLALAVSRCCSTETSRFYFAKLNGVTPLVSYLHSQDLDVVRSASTALNQLAKDANVSNLLLKAQIVPVLLALCGSEDDDLQDEAAGTLASIRRFHQSSRKSGKPKHHGLGS